MDIDEAINHCYDVANTCKNEQCSFDHIQLAKWLEELKELRLKDHSLLKWKQ